MAETVRIIKKYQNRKLYDTQDSCYVTLDGIAKMIRDGEEIVVIDNNTKEDVTALILTQVLYEQEKTHQSVLPVSILKNIIKSGSNNLFEFMQKFILNSFSGQSKSQEDLQLHVERLVRKGDLSDSEGMALINQIHSASMPSDSIDQRIDHLLSKYLTEPAVQSSRAELQSLQDRVSTLESPTLSQDLN